MKKYAIFSILWIVLSLCVNGSVHAQKRLSKAKMDLLRTVDSSLNQSARQYKFLITQVPDERFPVTYYEKSKKLVTSSSEPWVGGFYPGALLYLFEETRDTLLYREALKKLKSMEKEQFNKTTHDLGFMMYCSFGNANRIEPKPKYDNILLNSARSLSSRFNEKVGCIRSWDSDAARYMVIIDNMMNLELLFETTKSTGDSAYYKIAVTHANTTLLNHFRSDFSSYHLVIYDPLSGNVRKKQTVQGAFDESAWSRGQSWGLYGYTMCYRETKDPIYLKQAIGIADFILHHPNLPKDKVPYWDFNAPGIPDAPRDVSAAAVICSALMELSAYTSARKGKEYMKAAEDILRSLCSPEYKASVGENGGFLLKHGVGNFPRNADIDVPLIYADYYFAEALHRYKALNKK